MLQRYRWAWNQVHELPGWHLDIGCGPGRFVTALGRTTGRPTVGVEVSEHEIDRAGDGDPQPHLPRSPMIRVAHEPRLPFADGSVTSATLLDVLEHLAEPGALLAEVTRVLVPGGLAVVTVPARHAWSVLDPDNVKVRAPRLHRLATWGRHSRVVYDERYRGGVDTMVGDLGPGVRWHTNYEPSTLAELLGNAGLLTEAMVGSGFWFRWVQIPALLLGGRPGAWFDRALVRDGERLGPPGSGWSRRANLFAIGRRPG